MNNHPELAKFLVISYDPDQQQWFHDVVLALDADAAKEWVTQVREYVVDAEALTMADIKRFADFVPELSRREVEDRMAELAEESRKGEVRP